MKNTTNRKQNRRLWKQDAKAVVKKHYVLFVLLCLIAVFFGTEFQFVTSNAHENYRLLTGQDPDGTGSVILIDDQSILDYTIGKLTGKEADAENDTHIAEKLEQMTEDRLAMIKGGQRGALSSVASFFTSGKIVDRIAEASLSLFQSTTPAAVLLILLSTGVVALVWIFLQNVYRAVLRRMFLEARIYDGVPLSRLLHFRVVRRWARASLAMLLESVYEVLWSLTIVGGVIKRYSYLMVPFIVAENPDIRPKQAILLSRRMMDGHKWEAFIFEYSFLLWHIVGFFTFGIVDAAWTVPYEVASQAEFYAALRKEAREKNIPGAELLNDEYLYQKAGLPALQGAYRDIAEQQAYIEAHQIELSPVRAFFARNFGLWTGKIADKKEYDDVENRRQQIVVDQAEADGHLYPVRLNPLWKEDYNRVIRNARALRSYTVWSIILVFFLFSFIGWGWEVSIHLVKDGVFVNRGVMHGPWLPVYGSGVAMILVVLARWRRNPAAEAVLTVLLCGFVEYMTSFYLEMTQGLRWWDYTGYFLNLNGRICGEGLAVFAVGGMAAVYLAVPVLDAMLSRLNYKKLAAVSVALAIVFAGDMVYSKRVPNTGEGITDYDAYKDTGRVEQIYTLS
ncbi:MAG: DUF975 family protein [Clostridia bacterium]|nr:DUF975 family protein [Clostridia bacterium]